MPAAATTLLITSADQPLTPCSPAGNANVHLFLPLGFSVWSPTQLCTCTRFPVPLHSSAPTPAAACMLGTSWFVKALHKSGALSTTATLHK